METKSSCASEFLRLSTSAVVNLTIEKNCR